MGDPAAGAWLAFPRPTPEARLRLICLPYTGAGASLFRRWPELLPPDIEVCAVQLPGRENRRCEQSFTRIGPLVEALAGVVRPLLDKPYALFGHSLGALVAFELARRLRSRDLPEPIVLCVSACDAPQGRTAETEPAIHVLPDAAVIEHVRRLGGTPEEVLGNAGLMRALLPAIRADLAVLETYTYEHEEPLTCPIAVFSGAEDRAIGSADLAAWQEQTRGHCPVRLLPGDHFFMQDPGPLLEEIARILRDNEEVHYA